MSEEQILIFNFKFYFKEQKDNLIMKILNIISLASKIILIVSLLFVLTFVSRNGNQAFTKAFYTSLVKAGSNPMGSGTNPLLTGTPTPSPTSTPILTPSPTMTTTPTPTQDLTLTPTPTVPVEPPVTESVGNLQVKTYECNANALISELQRPDLSGNAVIPVECSSTANINLAYIYQAEMGPVGNINPPYPGLDDSTSFTEFTTQSDQAGIFLAQLDNIIGRYMLASVTKDNEKFADYELHGLLCDYDRGIFTNNYEASFLEEGRTEYCNLFLKPVTLNVKAYVCDNTTVIDQNQRPDTTGQFLLPSTCTVSADSLFGYIHQADKGPLGNLTPLYPGFDDHSLFTPFTRSTNHDGEISIRGLSTTGRYMLAAIDQQGNRLADEETLGFLCSFDQGTYTNNYEAAFMRTGALEYCTYFRKNNPLVNNFEASLNTQSLISVSIDETSSEPLAILSWQEPYNAQIKFDHMSPYDSLEYELSYKRIDDQENEVQEMRVDDHKIEADSLEIKNIYLSTCSSGGFCSPHLIKDKDSFLLKVFLYQNNEIKKVIETKLTGDWPI